MKKLAEFVGLLLTVTIRFGLSVPRDLICILLGSAASIALLLKVDILWIILIGTNNFNSLLIERIMPFFF